MATSDAVIAAYTAHGVVPIAATVATWAASIDSGAKSLASLNAALDEAYGMPSQTASTGLGSKWLIGAAIVGAVLLFSRRTSPPSRRGRR